MFRKLEAALFFALVAAPAKGLQLSSNTGPGKGAPPPPPRREHGESNSTGKGKGKSKLRPKAEVERERQLEEAEINGEGDAPTTIPDFSQRYRPLTDQAMELREEHQQNVNYLYAGLMVEVAFEANPSFAEAADSAHAWSGSTSLPETLRVPPHGVNNSICEGPLFGIWNKADDPEENKYRLEGAFPGLADNSGWIEERAKRFEKAYKWAGAYAIIDTLVPTNGLVPTEWAGAVLDFFTTLFPENENDWTMTSERIPEHMRPVVNRWYRSHVHPNFAEDADTAFNRFVALLVASNADMQAASATNAFLLGPLPLMTFALYHAEVRQRCELAASEPINSLYILHPRDQLYKKLSVTNVEAYTHKILAKRFGGRFPQVVGIAPASASQIQDSFDGGDVSRSPKDTNDEGANNSAEEETSGAASSTDDQERKPDSKAAEKRSEAAASELSTEVPASPRSSAPSTSGRDSPQQQNDSHVATVTLLRAVYSKLEQHASDQQQRAEKDDQEFLRIRHDDE